MELAPARKGLSRSASMPRYGRSRLDGDPSVPGWVLHGIESPKITFCGSGCRHYKGSSGGPDAEGADPARTVLKGGSFGRIGRIGRAVDHNLAYVAVSVPTFGAYSLRRTLVGADRGKK